MASLSQTGRTPSYYGTQLLNADADLVSIQKIQGHTKIKTTQRCSKLSNLKAQRDYFRAMEQVITKTAIRQLE